LLHLFLDSGGGKYSIHKCDNSAFLALIIDIILTPYDSVLLVEII